MPDKRICYRKIHRYKYQLMEAYAYQTDITDQPGEVTDCWVVMDAKGLLEIKKGYAWDGASGPAIDTKNFMRSSLVHDALYQLMREGKLSQDKRKVADDLLCKICLEDGMSYLRAGLVYRAVRSFGRKHTKRRPPEPYEWAPREDH